MVRPLHNLHDFFDSLLGFFFSVGTSDLEGNSGRKVSLGLDPGFEQSDSLGVYHLISDQDGMETQGTLKTVQ